MERVIHEQKENPVPDTVRTQRAPRGCYVRLIGAPEHGLRANSGVKERAVMAPPLHVSQGAWWTQATWHYQ